jgi:hypothetical protein
VVVSLLLAVLACAQVQTGPSVTPTESPAAAEATTEARRQLAGTWEYNPDLSVDVATGRSESAPGRNPRRGVGGGAGAGQGRNGGAGLGPTSASVVQDGVYRLSLARRDTRRDLLEIAARLSIAVAPAVVKITDDLDRDLLFPQDGSKQSYQLGAALFDARSGWDGNRFNVDIEGPDGLRMTETWFVSEDGARLFVVIRVGDPDKSVRPVGVNRVYDRVQ